MSNVTFDATFDAAIGKNSSQLWRTTLPVQRFSWLVQLAGIHDMLMSSPKNASSPFRKSLPSSVL